MSEVPLHTEHPHPTLATPTAKPKPIPGICRVLSPSVSLLLSLPQLGSPGVPSPDCRTYKVIRTLNLNFQTLD